MARNDSLLANFDKGRNTKEPCILSYIICRWAIYSLPLKLYHLHLRYSLTALHISCDQSVEDRTKRIAGETRGLWQNSSQYCLLHIPYQYDSSWPWTLSKTQNIGKWLEQTAWKTSTVWDACRRCPSQLASYRTESSLPYTKGPSAELCH